VVDAVVAASRALVGVAARSLAGLEEEVTLGQYRALVVLCARGPLGVAQLAEQLAVNPSTVTRLLDRLVAKGLARRQRTSRDRRCVRVRASAAGAALVREVTARRRAEIGRIVAAMPARSHAGLVDALTQFARAAGEVPDQHWAWGWQ